MVGCGQICSPLSGEGGVASALSKVPRVPSSSAGCGLGLGLGSGGGGERVRGGGEGAVAVLPVGFAAPKPRGGSPWFGGVTQNPASGPRSEDVLLIDVAAGEVNNDGVVVDVGVLFFSSAPL